MTGGVGGGYDRRLVDTVNEGVVDEVRLGIHRIGLIER